MTSPPPSPLGQRFAAQRAHRQVAKAATADERIDKLRRLRSAIADRRTEFERALSADFRKPAFEVDFTEITSVLLEIDHAIRHVKGWIRPRRVGTPLDFFGTASRIVYEPLGVVLIIGPWNYPFALTMSPLVAALSAGNCCVIKPSELTPATSAATADLVAAVFPPEEVTVVEGGIDVAKAVLALPFDHIFFTGSIPVGKIVMAAAAEHLSSVTLELGGKSPTIIDETANLDLAAQRVVWAKFINGGQTCVAPDYVWIHESRATAFVDAARRALTQFYGATEDARQQTPDLARIIDDRNFTRLKAMLDTSVAEGATLEEGGRCVAAERYISPTILGKVTWDMAVMRDEIFGPILPVLTYRSLDDVYERLRNENKPLALYIFTGDNRRANDIVHNTTAGGTVVNNAVIHAASSYLPFGGVGASGMGNYHGEFGFRTLSHERAVLTQGPFRLLRHAFPPYSATKQRALDFLIRLLARR